MIKREVVSNEWITEIAKAKKADKALIQKLVRALMLLEGLSESNLKFVFKGGTALMLMLNSMKRLSIDIDIIIPEKVGALESILSEIVIKKGFLRLEEQYRSTHSGIEKAHYKFYFHNVLKTDDEDFVLLDILFEEIHYKHFIISPIQSLFVMQEGEATTVVMPDFNNIMGDKLTAFAPNTTGIPYYKKGRPMGQEMMKQLYDIGNIFEKIDDVAIVNLIFSAFATTELRYRNINGGVSQVFEDIVETCLSLSLRQKIGNANLDVLLLGLKQITNYIFSEAYYIEKATTHAARTAYLVMLMQTARTDIERYSNEIDMITWQIEQPHPTKLNKLKKTNPEAFYYWFRYYEGLVQIAL